MSADEAPSHDQLARAYLELLTRECRETAPIFEGGQLWICPNSIWYPLSLEQASVGIGANFSGTRNCRRKSDYNAIALHAGHIVAQKEFFSQSPWGLITPKGFWRFNESGEIICSALTSGDRQRFQLKIDPDFDHSAPLWNHFLDHAFKGEDSVGQVKLLCQAIGAALFGSLWRYQIAVLLLGRAQTGKSTALTIVKALFPKDSVCAVPPATWGNEYYVANLASKRLNIVGDLTGDVPLPPGTFKQVLGRDLITGRHPTHRPFEFVCDAAHFFNSNAFPATIDRSTAFFRRWRIISFDNAIDDENIDEEFDENIIAHELARVLAWAILGAQDLIREGKVFQSQTHKRLIEKWKLRANSVLEFLQDEDVVALHETALTSAVQCYQCYRIWATHVGRKNPYGRNEFYEQIDQNASALKVYRFRDTSGRWIKGLELTLLGKKYAA